MSDFNVPGSRPKKNYEISEIERSMKNGRIRSISEISSCFFGPRPWHIEIRHRVKQTSTIDLFGFETLGLKIRRLKLWKPTVQKPRRPGVGVDVGEGGGVAGLYIVYSVYMYIMYIYIYIYIYTYIHTYIYIYIYMYIYVYIYMYMVYRVHCVFFGGGLVVTQRVCTFNFLTRLPGVCSGGGQVILQRL